MSVLFNRPIQHVWVVVVLTVRVLVGKFDSMGMLDSAKLFTYLLLNA